MPNFAPLHAPIKMALVHKSPPHKIVSQIASELDEAPIIETRDD